MRYLHFLLTLGLVGAVVALTVRYSTQERQYYALLTDLQRCCVTPPEPAMRPPTPGEREAITQRQRPLQPGDTFTAADGCNTCTVRQNGSVDCTLMNCPPAWLVTPPEDAPAPQHLPPDGLIIPSPGRNLHLHNARIAVTTPYGDLGLDGLAAFIRVCRALQAGTPFTLKAFRMPAGWEWEDVVAWCDAFTTAEEAAPETLHVLEQGGTP